jgi:hypothetical protein
MLTVGQLIALETRSSVPPWHGKDLFKKYHAKSLTLRGLINAVANQKRAYFVEMRSISLLAQATSFSDFQQRWQSGEGQMSAQEVSALLNLLKQYGATLKFVTNDYKRAAIVGPASVPALPITPVNLAEMKSALNEFGDGVIAAGAGAAAAGTIPEPASPAVIAAGVVILAAGAGIKLGIAFVDFVDSAETPSETNSTDQTAVPQPEGDSVDDGEVYGDPPDGVDATQVAEELVVDLVAVPNGFDLNSGTGLPNIPGLDVGSGIGDGGDGSGGPSVPVSGVPGTGGEG